MNRIQFCRFLVFLLSLMCMFSAEAQSLRLNWSKEGDRCWFRISEATGNGTFYLLDVTTRQREPAFHHERVASLFSEQLGRTVSPQQLPIDRIQLTDSKDQFLLIGKGETWQLNRETYVLTKVERPRDAAPQRRLFLPVKNSENSSESTHITIHNQLESPLDLYWIGTDGAEHNYGSIAANDKRLQHTFVGHVWLLKESRGEPVAAFSAQLDDLLVIDSLAIQSVRRISNSGRGRDNRTADRSRGTRSPDGVWSVFVRDHQLWLRNEGVETQLSHDASAENTYARGDGTPEVRWSPDSKSLVAFQTKVVPERKVYIVESSPADQLQPKLHDYSYNKPGDELPTVRVHLFSLAEMREISVSHELMSNPWSLRFRNWTESGDRFSIYYNQRGHQVVRLLDIVSATGEVRTILEDQSPTFLHYSDAGKSVLEDLNNDEILWASERSGWNHLYRTSRTSGEIINPVTSGEWNVKRIEKIDRDAQRIWFYAVGVQPTQDPYHEHFCRVNFDGSGFLVLTSGDGTHTIEFEQDEKYFRDTYSRVDMAPVTELRESETGELISELHREETGIRFQGRRLTERFVAKGRDGETDIWGIIHWPRGFHPEKSYPVVENIYAGPHNHHVPKAFRSEYGHQHRIADAGMIVVQIDGMGTAWRSKIFHDVCHKNLKDAGFPDRIAWMKAAAEKFPQMDLSRVGIYGGSAGGQNAMAALLWHNEFYKVAVSDCGCHDNRMDKISWNEQWMGWPVDASYKENSNMEHAHLLEGNLMLLVGELDRNVDPASTTQVVRQLIKHNKDFEFVLVAGAGHGSAETPWASRKRLNFLKQHLVDVPASSLIPAPTSLK